MMTAARIIGTYSRVSRGRQRGIGRQRPEVVAAVALHRPLHAARPAVVRGQRQVPVAVEHAAQRLEVLRRRTRGLVRIRPLVDIPVVLQAVFDRRRAHELPDALRTGARQRVGLERAFDQRHEGQVERQTLGTEDALDHRQVVAAAVEPFLDETAEPALKQLDVAEHPGVERNGDVVRGQREVGFDGGRERRRRRFLGGRGQVEQRVDGRRLARLLREAIAFGERRDFKRADAIDQPIELLAQPRFGARAARRGQQHIDGAVELDAGAIEVADLQLALAGKIVFLRLVDERLDGVWRWGDLCRRRLGNRGRRRSCADGSPGRPTHSRLPRERDLRPPASAARKTSASGAPRKCPQEPGQNRADRPRSRMARAPRGLRNSEMAQPEDVSALRALANVRRWAAWATAAGLS